MTKYKVTLTAEERAGLEQLVAVGTAAAREADRMLGLTGQRLHPGFGTGWSGGVAVGDGRKKRRRNH